MMIANIILIVWMFMMSMFLMFVVCNIIRDIAKINDPTKWTNMEIIESVGHPGEKLIAFWYGPDLKDSFYIDEKGHPVTHDKN